MSINLNVIIYCLVIFSSFTFFIPSFLTDNLNEENISFEKLSESYTSRDFEISSVLSIGLICPLLINLGINTVKYRFYVSFTLIHTWILLLTVFISHLVLYFAVVPASSFKYILGILSCRNFLLLATSLSLMHSYGSYIWKFQYIIITTMCYAIHLALMCYRPYIHESRISSCDSVIMVLWILIKILVLVMSSRWIFHVLILIRSNILLSISDIWCSLYNAIFLLVMIVGTVYWKGRNLYEIIKSGLVVDDTYMITIYVVLISLINNQHILQDIICHKAQQDAHMKQMIVGYFSHELRSPLNTAMMSVNLLKNDLEKALQEIPYFSSRSPFLSSVMDTVGEIEFSCGTVVDILDDLLTYERIENGEVRLGLRDTPLEPLLDHNQKIFTRVAKEKNINLNFKYEDVDLSKIQCALDEAKMRTVFRNIFSHAVESAGDNGAVSVTVHVVHVGVPPAHTLRIDVTDTGSCFSKAAQEKMFHGNKIEFTAGVIEGGRAGGLGLLISHRILLLHQGELVYTAGEGGRGNTFSILLPFHKTSRRPTVARRSSLSDTFDVMAIQFTEPIRRLTQIMPHSATTPELTRGDSYKRRFHEGRVLAVDEEQPAPRPSEGSLVRSSSRRRVHVSSENTVFPVMSERERAMRATSPTDGLSWGGGVVGVGGAVNEDRNAGRATLQRTISMRTKLLNIEMEIKNENDGWERPFRDVDCSLSTGMTMELSPVPAPPHGERPVSTKVSVATHKHQSGKGVLIVDDAVMNRKMLARLVQPYFDRIDLAEDGLVAVERVRISLLEGRPYDLILMDYQMPNMDGPTAAECMRGLGFTAPIVGVTGNVLDDQVQTFISKGADRVLPKPVNLQSLKKVIEDL